MASNMDTEIVTLLEPNQGQGTLRVTVRTNGSLHGTPTIEVEELDGDRRSWKQEGDVDMIYAAREAELIEIAHREALAEDALRSQDGQVVQPQPQETPEEPVRDAGQPEVPDAGQAPRR